MSRLFLIIFFQNIRHSRSLLRLLFLFGYFLFLVCVQQPQAEVTKASSSAINWQNLDCGLDYADVFQEGADLEISILKIDPRFYEFTLESIGKTGGKPKTLGQWTTELGLDAAINASMYLPDGVTSTGYMRDESYINNPVFAKRFGAFFLSSPKLPNLPGAVIVDRDTPGWQKQIENYATVIQNYRMTNSNRRILWAPGGPLYSISAVGQTGAGKILFLHSRKPVDAYHFVEEILKLPLDATTIMYVEGGAQAGLAINTPRLKKILAQPHAKSLLVTGNLNAVLPNIIAVRRRQGGDGF